MTLKTILVHLADPKRAKRLLQVAVPLARAHDAHLIGLTIVPPYIVIPATESVGASVSIDEHRTAYRQDIDAIKSAFDEATRGQTFGAEWREADAGFGTAEAQLLQHGRAADLVVIGQRDDDWSYAAQLEAPDTVAINLGRPILLVPNAGSITSPPKRAVIAWNGRREAARAAYDAIAVLPRGAEVTVLWADTSADPAVGGDATGSDLAGALVRHGLSCETTRVRAPDGDAARCILGEAAARGADMIVMGAYGHSRLREFILGGASHDMLAGMDRLVLMSH